MKRTQALIALFLTLLLISCTPKTPITVLEYGKMDASDHKGLLILLRGRGGSLKDFEKYGIIDEVKKRKLPFDIVAPDAHFGYYRTETLAKRLKEDIIDPARAKGYTSFWLAGFSMGGLGSLFYLVEYPQDDIDGLLISSPFVGWRGIREEIGNQGGLEKWTPTINEKDWQNILWRWLKNYQQNPTDYPPIFLGYSPEDKVVGNGPELLATALRPKHVFTVEGGHDYPTFQKIWDEHLDRLAVYLQQHP